MTVSDATATADVEEQPEAEAPSIPTTSIDVPALGKIIGEADVPGLTAADMRVVLARLGIRAPSSARKTDLATFIVNGLRLTAMAEQQAEVKAIGAGPTPVESVDGDTPIALPAVPDNARDGVLPSLTRWQQIIGMAEYLAKSNLTPEKLRGKPHDVGSILLRAHDLGIPLTSALENLYVIDGKVGMEGKLMMALVRRDGHSITVDPASNNQGAVVHGTRADNGDSGSVAFTLDDALAAGLIASINDDGTVKPVSGKDVWRKYQADMLKWRAVARLCRELFSDCLAGVSYTPDELGYIEEDDATPARSGRAGESEPTVTHRQQCETIAKRLGALPEDLRVELRESLWKPRNFPRPEDLRPAMVVQAIRWLEEYEAKAAERDDTSDIPEAETVPDGLSANPEFHDDNGPEEAPGAPQDDSGSDGPVAAAVDALSEAVGAETVELCAGCQEPIEGQPIIGNDGLAYCTGCAPFALGDE